MFFVPRSCRLLCLIPYPPTPFPKDILQNRLLVVALLISMASTVLGAASTVTAVFGMNLGLPLAMAALPSSAAFFWGVLAGLVGGMAASFGVLLLWGRAAGLLPRAPHVRSPWLLDALWATGGGAVVAAAAGGGGAPGDARPPSSVRSRSWDEGRDGDGGDAELGRGGRRCIGGLAGCVAGRAPAAGERGGEGPREGAGRCKRGGMRQRMGCRPLSPLHSDSVGGGCRQVLRRQEAPPLPHQRPPAPHP